MRLSHAAALLSTCAALALTGCDNDESSTPDAGTLSDSGTPDAGDTAAPTVTGTTPAADEAHVAASTAITVRFNEPMKSDTGTVRVVVDGAQRALGRSHWVEEQRAFRVHPEEALPPGARVQVTVEADFEDVAGNRLVAPLTFHFTVHGTAAAKPHVTASNPAEGATHVLPVEMYKLDATNLALRKVVTLSFNEPMDTAVTQVTLVDVTTPANAPRTLAGTWSGDGLALTVAIPRPESDLPPLEQENQYTLDVTGLRSATGQPLDTAHAGLGNGKLDFTTGRRDGNVEHACTHALVNTPEAVTAGNSPTSFYPATDTGHVFYGLTLPANGDAFRGYTEVVTHPSREQPVALYLNRSVPVVVHDTTEAEALVASTLQPATPVCLPVITHVVKFNGPAGDRLLRLTFGPTSHEALTFVFERY